MSEEAVDFQIVAERILAAVLATVGPVEVSVQDLVAPYENKHIAINQESDDSQVVTIELVDIEDES